VIKIYGVAQSRAIRPLWMLEELGVPYELVPIDLGGGETRKPEFLRINPNGHIPVLVDGDFTLWESMAINLYLAEKYGRGKLWPDFEHDRAHTLQWSFWVMTECEAHLLQALWQRAILPAEQRDESKAAAAQEALAKPLAVLDAQLRGREYLLGGGFSAADLNVASVLMWAKPGRIELGACPAVAAWLARCTARPALKTAQRR
jgi:glutathione S-transferase